MRTNYGYDTYRGRSTLHTILKVVAILLAAVLILGGLALVFLGRYIVVSADGVRFVFPWAAADPAPVNSMEIVTPQPTELVVVTPEVPQEQWLQAVSLPASALTDGTAAQQVAAAGGNAALFDMKADDGALGYGSTLELAVQAKVSADDPDRNAAIRALNQTEGMYTVARVSCFKDDKLSDGDRTLNITTNSGYRWTDPEGLHWSSPTDARVRDYLTDVCLELAELGFDEILLDNAGYPTRGNLGYIKKGAAYDPAALDGVITGFYQQVSGALAQDFPQVKLSIRTTGEVLAGTDTLSGQTVESLAAAHRVWCLPPEQGEDYAAVLSAAGLEDPAYNLVSLVGEPGGEEESWALGSW